MTVRCGTRTFDREPPSPSSLPEPSVTRSFHHLGFLSTLPLPQRQQNPVVSRFGEWLRSLCNYFPRCCEWMWMSALHARVSIKPKKKTAPWRQIKKRTSSEQTQWNKKLQLWHTRSIFIPEHSGSAGFSFFFFLWHVHAKKKPHTHGATQSGSARNERKHHERLPHTRD